MSPYSMDLRERADAACDAREGTRVQIAKRFGVSTSWIRGLLQRRRETGSIAPLPQNAGRKPKLDDPQMQRLRRLVERRPDATLVGPPSFSSRERAGDGQGNRGTPGREGSSVPHCR